MTPEAQRYAMAEACGAVGPLTAVALWSKSAAGFLSAAHISAEPSVDRPKFLVAAIPDFLHDLNAVHAAEMILEARQHEKYLEWLTDVCQREWDDGRHFTPHPESAKARQRVEAYLRATNRWSDTRSPAPHGTLHPA